MFSHNLLLEHLALTNYGAVMQYATIGSSNGLCHITQWCQAIAQSDRCVVFEQQKGEKNNSACAHHLVYFIPRLPVSSRVLGCEENW